MVAQARSLSRSSSRAWRCRTGRLASECLVVRLAGPATLQSHFRGIFKMRRRIAGWPAYEAGLRRRDDLTDTPAEARLRPGGAGSRRHFRAAAGLSLKRAPGHAIAAAQGMGFPLEPSVVS